MTLKEIAGITGAGVPPGGSDKIFNSVSTDTRKLSPGDLFFALRGEKYDAHDFVPQAVEKGAGGLVLSREVPGIPPGVPVLIVPDTLKALQDLGSYNLRKSDVSVIAVTGSNGKTTTKDMISCVLGVSFKVLKNKGNFNNEIGLPLTLLNLDKSYDVAVLEMGMRGPGEIDRLCKIAGITGAVITTIGESHLELLGSVDNIARAKGEILDNVPENGFAVLNADSPFIEREALRNRGKTLYFSVSRESDLTAESLELTDRSSRFVLKSRLGNVDIFLPIPGRHNVSNALAAAGVGVCMGLSLDEIKKGLALTELSPMRMQFLDLMNITVINDVYNASPASTKAALDVLVEAAQPERRSVAVLGDMLELGVRAEPGHFEVGKHAAEKGVNLLFAFGSLAEYIAEGAVSAGMDPLNVFWFSDKKEMLKVLGENVAGGDVILVKGSRSMQMETVVDFLTGCFREGAGR